MSAITKKADFNPSTLVLRAQRTAETSFSIKTDHKTGEQQFFSDGRPIYRTQFVPCIEEEEDGAIVRQKVENVFIYSLEPLTPETIAAHRAWQLTEDVHIKAFGTPKGTIYLMYAEGFKPLQKEIER